MLNNLWSSTDKKIRDEDFGNLVREYYEQLSCNIRKMGSDPEKLFPYDAFKKELKLSGNIAFLLAPMVLEVSLAEAKDVSNFNEMCENIDNDEQEWNFIQGLSDSAMLVYKKRLNECIGDLVENGYFQKI